MTFKPKQVCADCHFFVRQARGVETRPIIEIETKDRIKTKNGDLSWLGEYYTLMCDFGVWDEGHNFPREQRLEILTKLDRRSYCFWWKHRPGMLLPAAKILQEREESYRQARRDRRLTLIGLWIAAIALMVSTWLIIAEKLHLWPFG